FISSPVRPWPPIQRPLSDVDYLLLSFSRTGNLSANLITASMRPTLKTRKINRLVDLCPM
ncbi:MAG TPA: hypothetical protein VKK06_10045, partial [Terriglobia bacterium]|nr:hypothetical protein [Terriglobia bacterium]